MSDRWRMRRAAAAAFALLAVAPLATAQETASPAVEPPVQAPTVQVPDTAARFYASRCTGCHTIGRGALTGPDLTTAIAWPEADLEKAILRMQEKAGAFTKEEVAAMIALLKDAAVKERVGAEQARIAQQFALKLAPPDAALGEKLFFGRAPFSNGGMACSACHEQGELGGGTLGPNLSGIHARMGEAGLLSALEKSPFKVMGPLYRNKPLTAQEIVHVTCWLKSVDSNTTPQGRDPLGPAAASLAALFMGVLVLGTRKSQRTGARRSLKRKTRS